MKKHTRFEYGPSSSPGVLTVKKATDTRKCDKVFEAPWFIESMKNLPESEVEFARNLLPKTPEIKDVDKLREKLDADGVISVDFGDDQEIRQALAMDRHINRICHNPECMKKNVKFRRCSKCHLVYYCSVDCQKADWGFHKGWCCNPDAGLDHFFMQPALVPYKDFP